MCLSLAFIHSFSQTQITINGKSETVYPINGTEPFTAFEIQPLHEIFASKKIAGFGESTHGTHEFYTTRLQFLKFLVSECGYKAVAFEATYGGGLFINDYVRYGKGNFDSVFLKLEFRVYNYQEIKDIIKWMRDYNNNKKEDEKISFYGFDMQTFYGPIQYLDQEINASSFAGKDEFNRIIQVIKNNKTENYKTVEQMSDKTVPDKLIKAYDELKKWFSTNSVGLSKVFSEKKKKQLELCLEDFKMAVLNSNSTLANRDSCMATMVSSIQQIENSGIMLYGHMLHIGRMDDFMNTGTHRFTPMGEYLKNKYGTGYYPVGLIFSEGGFTASEIKKEKNKPVSTSPKELHIKDDKRHSMSNQFSKTGINAFFIPFTQHPHPVFSSIQSTFSIPENYFPRNSMMYTISITPDVMFDGLIYVKETSGMRDVGIGD